MIERICLICHKPIKVTKVKVRTVCQGHSEKEQDAWLKNAGIAEA